MEKETLVGYRVKIKFGKHLPDKWMRDSRGIIRVFSKRQQARQFCKNRLLHYGSEAVIIVDAKENEEQFFWDFD